MQVVNYLPFDNQGQAPTVILNTSNLDIDSNTPGFQVEEGSNIPIFATITDDVQVRNAELIVNGEIIRNDVAFPFDFSAVVPNLSEGADTVTIEVRATDTGGNTVTSTPLVLDIVPDTFAPTIIGVTPDDNSVQRRDFRTVRIGFSEAIDEATLTPENIQLFTAFDPINPLTPINIQVRGQGQVVQLAYESIDIDDYNLVINSDLVTDRAGNPLGTGLTTISSFTVLDTVGYWRFEEGQPDTPVTGTDSILDTSRLNNQGTPFGSPVFCQ